MGQKRPRAPTRSRRGTTAAGIGSGGGIGGGGGRGRSGTSAGGAGGGGGGASVAALADVGNALLYSFLLPLGPLLIDRRLNAGYFRESDTPVWWALALLCFSGGQWLAGALRARASSWHLYMNRPPRQRAARVQLVALLGLVGSVVGTGLATRLEHLLLARLGTGFWAVFLWGHARERAAKGAAAANAGLAAAGRWSNNRILPLHHHQGHTEQGQQALGEEGPLVNPMAALGTILGGLIGGLAFPARTFTLVGGRPALLPALLAALCALLLGCLVLRRLNKELAALGSKNGEGGGPAYSRLSHEDLDASSASASSTAAPLIRKDAAASTSSSSSSTTAATAAAATAAPVVIEMGAIGPSGGSSTSTNSTNNSDPSHPPPTFLQACRGDAQRARAKWEASLAWRAREGVDAVLARPQPHFGPIKEFYPHYIHGRSKRGEMVMYEFPGRMDLGRLKAMGIGAREIGRHYIFVQEFMFRRLSQGDAGRVMTVLDIGGLGLGTLSKDVLDVLRTTSEIMNNHYPERVTRICVVNAPFFAGAAWRVLQAVLPQSVQDKIELTADPGPGLRKYIDAAHIPGCYQGASPLPLGESEEERQLRAVVAQANAAGGGDGNEDGAGPSVAAAAATPATPVSPARASAPAPTTPGASGSSSSGGGRSWLPSLFGSGGGGGKGKGKGKPQQAHLGYENRFVFDQQRKIWVLEEERPQLQPHTTPLARPTVAAPLVVTSSLASPAPSPAHPARHTASGPSPAGLAAAAQGRSPLRKLAGQGHAEEEEEEGVSDLDQYDDDAADQDDEEKGTGAGGAAATGAVEEGEEKANEEDGLILAIQAAHYAERLAREGRAHPSGLLLLGAEEGGSVGGVGEGFVGGGKEGGVGLVGGKGGGGDSGLGGGGGDAGLAMLVQTALVYALWAGLEGVVHAVLPVWVAAPHHLGGLGAKARGGGLMLALGAAACLALHTHGPASLLRLPWASPLRAFRAAVALVSLAALGLALHPRLGPDHRGAPPRGPARFTAWLLHAALLTALVASLAVGRAAAAVLLDMAARAHSGSTSGSGQQHKAAAAAAAAAKTTGFACSPRGLRRIREWSGEVAAPWAGAVLLSYGLQAGLPFPSDARLPFNLVALACVGLYCLTLQLRLRVSGDLGHLSLDAAEAHSANSFRFEQHGGTSGAAPRRRSS